MATSGTFLVDAQELKPGLKIFRRSDVQHRNWYCRVKLPNEDRYKTVSLKTADINVAKDKAFEQDADLRFRLKHEIPIFNRTFAQVAEEYAAHQKQRHETGLITFHRWRVVASHIKTQLNPYVGTTQITQIGEDKWRGYPLWRQKTGKGRSGDRVSEGTIKDEMTTFKAIMHFAADKSYIRQAQVFRGKVKLARARREEFTPPEYRKLHSFARAWIEKGRTPLAVWARTMAYNFILIMTNTGMRPAEAKNLRWRDVSTQSDKQGRKFVRLNVRGKGKFRALVAASKVAEYLDRIKAISKATGDDDFVFTEEHGKPARTLYYGTVERMLLESNLMLSSAGKRRSAYCFRHTYATFRLTEGVDVFFLAKQMGTSVKMIEDHYGHINPVKNADQILQGLPGWESIDEAPQTPRNPRSYHN